MSAALVAAGCPQGFVVFLLQVVAVAGSGGGGGVTGNSSQPSYAGGDGSQGIVIVSYVNDGSITATGGTITTASGTWQEIGT